MKTIEEIKSAVKHLPQPEFTRFRKWFDEYEAKQWDKQLENDINSGKLNKIARNVLNDFHSGNCSEL